MLTQDQQDLLDFLAQRVDDLAGKARAAAAGKARALINEAEELMAIRAAIIDRHTNGQVVSQLPLPLEDKQAA
tara:strand:- start:24 stop:242 length:219 start_codon:yes stop_codon:yes gene_type:complete